MRRDTESAARAGRCLNCDEESEGCLLFAQLIPLCDRCLIRCVIHIAGKPLVHQILAEPAGVMFDPRDFFESGV